MTCGFGEARAAEAFLDLLIDKNPGRSPGALRAARERWARHRVRGEEMRNVRVGTTRPECLRRPEEWGVFGVFWQKRPKSRVEGVIADADPDSAPWRVAGCGCRPPQVWFIQPAKFGKP